MTYGGYVLIMSTNKRIGVATFGRPAALGLALFAAAGTVAVAQERSGPYPAADSNGFDPQYDGVTTWNQSWDAGRYDRHHVLVGTVADFKPYRLLLQPRNPQGPQTMVDLKNGTVIRPEGTSLVPGMRVAVFGYWSKGTFIANHVVLRGG